jgi:hypothetical protein
MTNSSTSARPAARAIITAAALVALAACAAKTTTRSDSTAVAAAAAGSEAVPTATSPASNAAAGEPTLVVYKTPTCGCCKGWVESMEKSGFKVEVHDLPDLASIKHAAGVPDSLQACHTARIGGYVVEGHVPAADIRRLLAERPDVAGIATPGMPMGSPGMEGAYSDHYDVVTFGGSGRSTVYASH